MVEKVIIMGAAGRDFHNFNTYFKDNPRYQVVAFTAAQIPDIEQRSYPEQLSGKLYPKGIPIYPEAMLSRLITDNQVDLVAFSYSDVPHVELMHKASIAMACGADFIMIAASYTMLKAHKPVVAVCAVRTGCGKSQTTRKVCTILRELGKKVVVVRHPMPYGDLLAQEVQRFSAYEDFAHHKCTIEEREEYEPIVDQGIVVYAGVDYGKILARAQEEADIIVWDGGNNDTPFYRPDVHIVLFDPHRSGHELLYYPGETNMRMAKIAIINKVDSAEPSQVEQIRSNIVRCNPQAHIILASSPVIVNEPERVRGMRVLVVEDGPTLTHGGMTFGAGFIAAQTFKALEIVDPRPYAAGRSAISTSSPTPRSGTCSRPDSRSSLRFDATWRPQATSRSRRRCCTPFPVVRRRAVRHAPQRTRYGALPSYRARAVSQAAARGWVRTRLQE